jgi:cytochrome oxidase assembly protein ShyY1
MYRFLLKPKWILFHVLCIVLVGTMVQLGFWQLHRLQDRRSFNSEVTERAAMPVAPYADVMTPATDPDQVQWRRVVASGTYLPDEQLIEINRAQNGAAGVNVVTPMRLDDGTVLLVNRGFAPSPDMTNAEAPPAPAGPVEIEGRLRVSDVRSFGEFTEPEGELTQIQRIDIPRLAPQLPAPLAPVYVDLVASTPSETGGLAPVPDPELNEGPHLSYMLQWWFFSLCVVVGWVIAVRRSIGQRRKDASAALSAADGRTGQDSPPPVDDEPATAPS